MKEEEWRIVKRQGQKIGQSWPESESGPVWCSSLTGLMWIQGNAGLDIFSINTYFIV